VCRSFQTVSEGVFSETHIRETGTLCTSVPHILPLPPYKYRNLPQDVGVLDKYAGVWPAPLGMELPLQNRAYNVLQ
jgi:hypothetical protein